MQYAWRDGSRFAVKAQVAGERLSALREANGGHLTPSDVVADARPEESPLHGDFEWDDQRAADLHREETARSLIRSVRIVHVNEEGEEQRVMGYLHVQLPEVGPVYVSTARAMSEAELRQQVEEEALGGLRAWYRRYEHITSLAPIVAAIDRAARRVTKQRRRPAAARAVAQR